MATSCSDSYRDYAPFGGAQFKISPRPIPNQALKDAGAAHAALLTTIFDLPVRGTEIRPVSLLERDGVTKVIVPVYRDSKMGVMTLRSDADIAALKAQAK